MFKGSKPFNFTHFVVKYKPSSDSLSRFAISCGLKVSKRAIDRNTIKRRIFEAIQKQISLVRPGDYIFIVRPLAAPLSFREWEEQVSQAFLHIGKSS